MRSMASSAACSLSAATARIGSPTYMGSLVSDGAKPGGSRGDVVGGDHAEHAFHLERLGGVDVLHARVRHGAGEQPREHHAVDAEILGVLGRAGDLGHHVVRDEILADVLEVAMRRSPPCRRPRASRR